MDEFSDGKYEGSSANSLVKTVWSEDLERWVTVVGTSDSRLSKETGEWETRSASMTAHSVDAHKSIATATQAYSDFLELIEFDLFSDVAEETGMVTITNKELFL